MSVRSGSRILGLTGRPRADYAFAIAVISIVSIISTLLETRAVCTSLLIKAERREKLTLTVGLGQNIDRMREMSRFSCPVRILRDSEWVMADSSALVPGDIVDLSESSLATFPADLVLLSGDAIVNESMLTGESVPVSKVPVEAAGVAWVSSPGGEIKAELAKHVVYNGTKIIRIRKTMPGPASGVAGGELEAAAMVLRTGASVPALDPFELDG